MPWLHPVLWGPAQCLGSGSPGLLSPFCGTLTGHLQSTGQWSGSVLPSRDLQPYVSSDSVFGSTAGNLWVPALLSLSTYFK